MHKFFQNKVNLNLNLLKKKNFKVLLKILFENPHDIINS